MNRRPQILYLAHRTPYPPNRGDRIRSWHTLKFLAAYADVHLACLTEEPAPTESLAALNSVCAAVEVAPLGPGRWLRGVGTLAAGRSATEGLFHSRRLEAVVRRWAKAVRFDAALAFCSSMAPYLNLPELEPIPAVVDLVDVDSQKWFDYAATAPLWKRPLYALEGRRLRKLERSLPGRAEAVTLVSEAEAALFRRIAPNPRTFAVENGVDLDYFTPAPEAPTAEGGPDRCVFVGVLDYRANVEGLRWFCRHVWPEFRRRKPGATFAIVGRRPGAAVQELARLPGVELEGEVADVRPHVAGAKVVVAPLQVARGVQNKVLEALAMERAVIATPQALEGLDLAPGADALQAAAPADWIDGLLRLLDDAPLRRRLAHSGRTYVETRHHWQNCLTQFLPLLGVAEEVAAHA